jgi:hypothetical protein
LLIDKFMRCLESKPAGIGRQVVHDQTDHVHRPQRIQPGAHRRGRSRTYGRRRRFRRGLLRLRARFPSGHEPERDDLLLHAVLKNRQIGRIELRDRLAVLVADNHFQQHLARLAAENRVGLLRQCETGNNEERDFHIILTPVQPIALRRTSDW